MIKSNNRQTLIERLTAERDRLQGETSQLRGELEFEHERREEVEAANAALRRELFLIQRSLLIRLMVRPIWLIRARLIPEGSERHQTYHRLRQIFSQLLRLRELAVFTLPAHPEARSLVGGSFSQANYEGIDRLRRIKQKIQRRLQWILAKPNFPADGGIAAATRLQRGAYDIICLANIDWEARYQRPQQTMSQFARHGHRVFYIVASKIVRPGAKKGFRAVKVAENVFEVSLQASRLPNFYQEVMNQETEQSFLSSIEQLKREFQLETAIIVIHLPFWTSLGLQLRERWGWPVVYDCMDEWTGFPNLGRALLEQEVQLVQESELVTVTAVLLQEKWSARSKQCLLVRNGVDFDFFTAHCGPNDLLAGIKRPIIGYYGALAEWVDFELLYFLARQRPAWNFILIGDVFVDDLVGLDRLPNVHFLGRRPYTEMPLYLYHFDVCVIPFKLNEVTHAVDPVKFYEFISVGKPVVAVPLSELLIYKDYLYLANTPTQFLDNIELALNENGLNLVNARIALAKDNDWLDRYRKMERAIVELCSKASIIIVTYNNVELTQLCVESIFRNTAYPNYEIILVDNHSQDGTANYLRYLSRNYEQVKIILNPENKGFATANNQGLCLATGDYLVLLNNDTVVSKGWLTSLIKHLQNPQVGLVGPVTNFVGNEAKINVSYITLEQMESFAADYTQRHEGEIFDINMLAMYCVAMRRDIFEQVGPLDERFGVGMFEDDDYSFRVKQKDYRVVCAEDTFIHHFGQAAFKALLETGEYHRLWETNRSYFESKWGLWQPHREGAMRLHHLRKTP
jgi:GT2 family glycosyltransferase